MVMSYREMPKSTASVPGMKMLKGNTSALRVMIAEDVCYGEKSGKKLHLRILKPMNVDKLEETRPVMIHIQGSAWHKQDLNDHVMDLKAFAEAGYLVVIVEYRESDIVKIPGQVYDAKDAVRYVSAHAEELHADVRRMYVSGDSSGGHTALLCWATWNSGELDESSEPLPAIRAFMDFYGVVDLVAMGDAVSAMDHMDPHSPESMALGGVPVEMPEAAAKASVLSYIHPETVNQPLLILHGNKDRLVPFEQSVLLYEACVKAGKDAEFYCVDDSDHGGAAFYCEPVYHTVLKFLAEH